MCASLGVSLYMDWSFYSKALVCNTKAHFHTNHELCIWRIHTHKRIYSYFKCTYGTAVRYGNMSRQARPPALSTRYCALCAAKPLNLVLYAHPSDRRPSASPLVALAQGCGPNTTTKRRAPCKFSTCRQTAKRADVRK